MMGGPGSGPRKRAGRPTKLTPAIHDEIVKLMRAGNYFETACGCVDVRPETARKWLRMGNRKSSGPYHRFLMAVKKAESEAEAHALVRIRQAGKQTWTAEAWYLERKFPAKWGRWERTQANAPEQIDKTRELVSRKEVRDLLDEVARRISVAGDSGSDGDGSE